MEQDRESERIHVLGLGSIGKFLAHSIKSQQDSPPVTLLYHRTSLLEKLGGVPQCNLILNTDDAKISSGPFDVRLAIPAPSVKGFDADEAVAKHPDFVGDEPIRHLICSVKAHQTISALKPLKDRLGPDSTILFCQNGMGILDQVLEQIWPEEEKEQRPNFMRSVNTHGVFATSPFDAVHAGHGVIYVSLVPPSQTRVKPREFDQSVPAPPSSMHLLRSITRVPVLAAVAVSDESLQQRALEKLAVNCVINPLTALFDCRNGQLINNFSITRTMRLLLAEISLVLRSLPEFKGVPNVDLAFSPEKLEDAVVDVATKTGNNISSMLQDMRRGQRTEIDFMNGYVVRRGEEIGIKPVMNYLVTHMIRGKQAIVSREVNNFVPFDERVSQKSKL